MTMYNVYDDDPIVQLQQAIRVIKSLDVQVMYDIVCAQTKDASMVLNIPLCNNDVYGDENNSHNDRWYESQHHRTLEEDFQKSTIPEDVFFPVRGEWFYIINIIGTIVCIGFVALIAGLYLGLLTLDVIDLEIIQRVSLDEHEIMYATNLLPIVKQRHRLLVTLLILNAVAYETLPIFLDNLLPQWVTVLLSITLILVFGEIIPSAIFTGPNQLMLGNSLAPLTLFFMWLLNPLALPLSYLLDYIVHGHIVRDPKNSPVEFEPVYNRSELSALVRIQHESRMAAVARNNKSLTLAKNQKDFKEKKMKDESWNSIKKEIMERVNERLEVISERNNYHSSVPHHHHNGDEEPPEAAVEQLHPPLHPTEVDLVTGALQMKTRLVMDEYTPLRKVYALPDNLIFDVNAIAGIYAKGYSRMPVYRYKSDDPDDRTGILGFLMIRQLILIDWDHMRELSTMPLQRPDCISPRMNLVDALELLRTGGTLMAFVCARPEIGNKALENELPLPVEAGFMGIITLEDVMESIMQGRVYDEWDIKDRDRAIATLHRWAATKLQKFVRRKRDGRRLSSNNNATHGITNSMRTIPSPTSVSPFKELYVNNYSTDSGDNISITSTSSINTSNHPYYDLQDSNNENSINNETALSVTTPLLEQSTTRQSYTEIV